MKQNLPERIHIIGSVGSGKTTLARALSKRQGIPHYELDNIVWERHPSGDIRRSDEERDACLAGIIATKRWIIEGAHHQEWVGKSFRNADFIVFLDVPYRIRIYRIIKRYIWQLLALEEANYKPSFKMFKSMFRWNRIFEKEGKPRILAMLNQVGTESLVLKDCKDFERSIGRRAVPLKEDSI